MINKFELLSYPPGFATTRALLRRDKSVWLWNNTASLLGHLQGVPRLWKGSLPSCSLCRWGAEPVRKPAWVSKVFYCHECFHIFKSFWTLLLLQCSAQSRFGKLWPGFSLWKSVHFPVHASVPFSLAWLWCRGSEDAAAATAYPTYVHRPSWYQSKMYRSQYAGHLWWSSKCNFYLHIVSTILTVELPKFFSLCLSWYDRVCPRFPHSSFTRRLDKFCLVFAMSTQQSSQC